MDCSDWSALQRIVRPVGLFRMIAGKEDGRISSVLFVYALKSRVMLSRPSALMVTLVMPRLPVERR